MIIPINIDFIRSARPVKNSKRPPVDIVRNFLMVGARPDKWWREDCWPLKNHKQKLNNLSNEDKVYLLKTISMLERKKIAIASELNVQLINIDKRWGGEDLLNPKKSYPAEVLVICNIFNGHAGSWRSGFINFDPYLLQSKRHFSPDAWLNSARRSNARYVCTIGGKGYEVTEKEFPGPEWLVLGRGQTKRGNHEKKCCLLKHDLMA